MKEARKLAALRGDVTFQGRDCKVGHGGTRYVSSGGCVACTKQSTQFFREELAQMREERAKRGAFC